jgi:hypothetical protein
MSKIMDCKKECKNCIFFERRRGMYDSGYEQGRCTSRNYYVLVIDSCDRFKSK